MQENVQPVLVSTTCGDSGTARAIAELVLEKRLAACVQISTPITSLYWWDGKIASDSEYLLTMKSDSRLFGRLALAIGSVHPYEVPEIIAVDIAAVDPAYARWLRRELTDVHD